MQKSFSDTHLLNVQQPHMMMCSDVTKKTSPSIPSFLSGCFIYYVVPRFYAPQWFASRLHLPLSKVSPFDHRKPLPIPWHLHWKPQTSLDPDDHEELGCTRRSARTLKKFFCDIFGTWSKTTQRITRQGKDTLKLKPNLQIAKFTNPTKLIQKNVCKIQPFFLTKIRQLSGILKRKTQQCDTFFNFVVFCCFGSKMFASSVFRDQIFAVQSKSPTATSRLSASRNGTGDLRETLQNLREA